MPRFSKMSHFYPAAARESRQLGRIGLAGWLPVAMRAGRVVVTSRLAVFAWCATVLSIAGLATVRAQQSAQAGKAAASPPGTQLNPAVSGTQKATKKTTKPSPERRRSNSPERTIVTVTITGRALDHEGRPLSDAVIQVVDDNAMISPDRVLGKTKSGADGRYVLRDVSLPVFTPAPSAGPKPTEGRFEVSGWAPGKALTWHKTQSYRPEPRPAAVDAKDSGQVFYHGETIVADLVFGPPARLRGTVTDDTGQPVAGALVQVGFVNDIRVPEAFGMWYCAAIDPQHGDDIPFSGVASLPAPLRSALTDDRGNYAIEGLPREAKLTALIDFKPSYAAHSLTIATSAQQLPGVLSVGHDGILNHTFVVPRTVRVHATLAPTSKPAAGVTIVARGTKLQRSGNVGTTNNEGMVVLQLQPDNYTLRIEPPLGLQAVVSEQSLVVTSEPRESSIEVAVEPGAIVMFEAAVEGSGEPIAGVGFEYETDTTRVRKPVHSQTVFVDHPVTGSDGRLRTVMPPGARRFIPVRTPGIDPVPAQYPLTTLVPGQTAVLRFAFKKAAGPQPEIRVPPQDALSQRLKKQWKTQRELIRHGRARATRHFLVGSEIAADQLTKLLDALDPDRVPPILELIRNEFPDAEPAAAIHVDVTVDEPRRREQWGKPHPEVFVFNGNEGITFRVENGQVDLTDRSGRSNIGISVTGIANFCHVGELEQPITERANGKVTLERKTDTYRVRRAVDESTGFDYRNSFRYNNGSSATEHWQFAPRTTAHGLVVPSMSVEFHSYDNRINSVMIWTIESIDVKSPVAPESFVVSVPAGTLIVDYREGRDDTYRGTVLAPVTDILTRADEIAATHKRFVPPVKAGDPAPAIMATAWLNQSGKTDPPDLKGKVVLVDFWGITCGPCVGQLPEVREAAEHFAGTPLTIIGLHDSSGTVKEVAEFAARRGITFPLAIDRAEDKAGWFGATFAAYGIRGIPSAAVLDRQGRVAFVGPFREAIEKAAALLKEK